MPRKSRQKHAEAIYHIMCRSQSEILLFRDDEDKNRYLLLLKKCIERFKCSLYAYCLMDNHLHLHLDPKGYDVSSFMHSLNTAYVRYYNHKYSRHGHVFQGRFESRMLDTREYNLTVSAYIHNNPHDIEGFSGKEESYCHSSYGIYLGIAEDIHKLVDMDFIMDIFGTKDPSKFAEKYFSFVSHQRDIGSFKNLKSELSVAIEYEYVSGRKVILRDFSPSKIISFISSKFILQDKDKNTIPKHKLKELRALAVYALKALSGLSYKDICNSIYNITISGCSRLCSRGYALIHTENSIYSNLMKELTSVCRE